MLSKAVFSRESEIKIEMRKVSFGGDRSEAGRYAANVRWQGHTKGKKDKKDFSFKTVAKRINDATASIRATGMKIERLKPDTQGFDWNLKVQRGWAQKTFEKIREIQYPEPSWRRDKSDYVDRQIEDDSRKKLPDKFRLGALMIEKALALQTKADGIFVIGETGIVSGAASYRLFKNLKAGSAVVFDYAGSHGVVKGVGSALFGRIVQVAAAHNAEIVLGALEGSVSFWEGQGFQNDGRSSTRELFNMKLTREKVQELAGLLDD